MEHSSGCVSMIQYVSRKLKNKELLWFPLFMWVAPTNRPIAWMEYKRKEGNVPCPIGRIVSPDHLVFLLIKLRKRCLDRTVMHIPLVAQATWQWNICILHVKKFWSCPERSSGIGSSQIWSRGQFVAENVRIKRKLHTLQQESRTNGLRTSCRKP